MAINAASRKYCPIVVSNQVRSMLVHSYSIYLVSPYVPGIIGLGITGSSVNTVLP